MSTGEHKPECLVYVFISVLNVLLCSSVADSAVDLVQELSTQSEWTTGPVPPPDQLGSKARLMTVVNLASEEWSSTHWTASLCDWVACVYVLVYACMCLLMWGGLNDDKQMPAVGASTHNLAPRPPEITHTTPLCHLAGPHLVTLWVCWREGKWSSMIPSLLNKLIKLCVLHPEAISKWLSHSSVVLLIEVERKSSGGRDDEGWKQREMWGTGNGDGTN